MVWDAKKLVLGVLGVGALVILVRALTRKTASLADVTVSITPDTSSSLLATLSGTIQGENDEIVSVGLHTRVLNNMGESEAYDDSYQQVHLQTGQPVAVTLSKSLPAQAGWKMEASASLDRVAPTPEANISRTSTVSLVA